MSTYFSNEGNIGTAPEFREIPNGNDEPHRLLRLSVYFDNPVRSRDRDGDFDFEDHGGFWAPVELWHRDAGHWAGLYAKGMRVWVDGRMVRDEWRDAEGNDRVTYKIEARRVAILPYRIERVILSQRQQEIEDEAGKTGVTG